MTVPLTILIKHFKQEKYYLDFLSRITSKMNDILQQYNNTLAMYLGENKHVYRISEVESTGPVRKAIFTPNVSKHKEIMANSEQQTLGLRTISICLQRSKEHRFPS